MGIRAALTGISVAEGDQWRPGMRVRTVAGGVTVNAVAGSYVVVLGLNVNDANRAGLRGFAIQRDDRTEGETFWMKGMKTFQSVEPHPAGGEQFSSLVH